MLLNGSKFIESTIKMIRFFDFDGTQNGLDDLYPTNIRLISELADLRGQKIHYFEGPGNDETNKIEHFLGTLFGSDMDDIIEAAIKKLKKIFKAGDIIVVFGFSRGAAIARRFCYMIGLLGYETEFLGCFDTVFAMMPFGPLQQHGFFSDLHVSPMVKNARHAVALNEDRKAFSPNLMNSSPKVKEMWFKGNHADIGGGYKEAGLSNIALHWMLSEARQCVPVVFGTIARQHATNSVHREKMPLRRAKRIPVVLIDGKSSEIPPLIYDKAAK